MSRRSARKNAFYLIFQQEFTNNYEETKEIFFKVNEGFDEEDREFIEKCSDGVFAHKEELDEMINSASKGWSTTRLSKVDLSILQLAVYEIEYMDDIPEKVSVNEAVNLAKKYGAESAAPFVNGVLGSVIGAKKGESE